ncbi:hypothetical protein DPMN_024935 [Dreissena polymorpha]|uniref:Reverse transcriptase n=1 Tax=Dreissena polymorpha TaxID=45954 RepID=A0A9D4LND6_DREPO|nr:hypothetical protein DPMN_024935 [Dreissena polymorpha]
MNTARFNRDEVSAPCKLCNMGDETREHLLLTCKAHTEVRSEGMNMLEQIIGRQELAAIRCNGDLLMGPSIKYVTLQVGGGGVRKCDSL